MKQFKIKQSNKLSTLVTLGASLLGTMLAGWGINRAGYGSKDLQSKGDWRIRAGFRSNQKIKSTSSFNIL